jgi:ribosomal protein S1
MIDLKDFTRCHKFNIQVIDHINLDLLDTIVPCHDEEEIISDSLWEIWEEQEKDFKSYLKTVEVCDSWTSILVALRDEIVVEGLITSIIKGGFKVLIFDMEAFLPCSHVGILPIENVKEFLNKTIKLLVVKVNSQYKEIVVSHKAYVKKYLYPQYKQEAFSHIHKGDIISGKVYDIRDNKIIFEMGGFHYSFGNKSFFIEKNKCIKSKFKLNNEYPLVVTNVDSNKPFIELNLKLAIAEALKTSKYVDLSRYKTNSVVRGRIVYISSNGIFVDIGDIFANLSLDKIELDAEEHLELQKIYNFFIDSNPYENEQCNLLKETMIQLRCDFHANTEMELNYLRKKHDECLPKKIRPKTKSHVIDYESDVMYALANGCGDAFGFD